MGCKGGLGVFPTTKGVHWDGPRSDDCHHQAIILVESIVETMEGVWESSFWIFIRHPSSLIFGEAIIQGLEESADLVFVVAGARENYGSFTIVEG